ncbi:MAG: hypothetical protein AABW49_01980 [Nanoarchaeota archaeon]
MKIMKVIDKKVGDTVYYKYRINLPKKIVENSRLLEKDLVITLEKGKILISNIE